MVKEKNDHPKVLALSIQQEYIPVLRRLQMESQNRDILKHLLWRGTITQKEAVNEYNCYRLSARIKDLRDMGVAIHTEMLPTKNGRSRYAEYSIETGGIK